MGHWRRGGIHSTFLGLTGIMVMRNLHDSTGMTHQNQNQNLMQDKRRDEAAALLLCEASSTGIWRLEDADPDVF
jgi:hypothetical protein